MKLNVAFNTHSPLLLRLIFSTHSNNNFCERKNTKQKVCSVNKISPKKTKFNCTVSCISCTLTWRYSWSQQILFLCTNKQTTHKQRNRAIKTTILRCSWSHAEFSYLFEGINQSNVCPDKKCRVKSTTWGSGSESVESNLRFSQESVGSKETFANKA